MTIEQFRAQIVSSIWQAIMKSKVDLAKIAPDQQEKLVSAIADQMLLTLDDMLDNIAKPEPIEENNEKLESQEEVTDEYAEKTLWQGRPFLSLVERYTLTSERLKIVKGLISRDVENFELIRVQDIDLTQRVGERILGLGDIAIRGHDPSLPVAVLRNVKDPEKVYEVLRRAWLDARKRHGLQFREFM